MSAGDREAEAQAKKGEEGSTQELDSRAAAAMKKYWCIGLRVMELVVAVIAIGLIVGALDSVQLVHTNKDHIAVIYSAYSTFIIIIGVLVVARIFGESPGWKISLGISILGVIMFTAASAVIFYDWHTSYYSNYRPNKRNYDLLISSGVFAVIDVALFLIHAFLTFKKEAGF